MNDTTDTTATPAACPAACTYTLTHRHVIHEGHHYTIDRRGDWHRENIPTTAAPFVMVRHGIGMHAANEPQVVGFLTEHGVWESMQRHGLRFSELRAHIADVKAGYIVTADDGFEWRLAD